MIMNHNAPIGVFDSGVGGLTVLDTLKRTFPFENFIYLADSAYCPYGIKTSQEIAERVNVIGNEMINRGVKAIIIACNTATANAQSFIAKAPIPVIGVIKPTAQRAYEVSENKRIALLATDLTVKMGVYEKELLNATVYSLGASVFVPIAEDTKRNSQKTYEIVSKHLEPLKNKDFDTIIYGCTHFGLLDEFIQKALPHKKIIDSGGPTGIELAKILTAHKLKTDSNTLGTITLYTTGEPEVFKEQISWFANSYIGPLKW